MSVSALETREEGGETHLVYVYATSSLSASHDARLGHRRSENTVCKSSKVW